VEDSSTLVLHYKNGINIFEGSWDLPRSFQDLEVFGRTGSLYMTQQKVELRTAKETTEVPLAPLPPEAADPSPSWWTPSATTNRLRASPRSASTSAW